MTTDTVRLTSNVHCTTFGKIKILNIILPKHCSMHSVDAMCKWKHEKIFDIDGVMEVSV